MKITRYDIITIAKKAFKIQGEKIIDEIDYKKWISFINENQNIFTWYEDTKDGKDALESIDETPDWAKEAILYMLDKKRVLVKEELIKNYGDLGISYSENDKRIHISLDENLNKKSGKVLLEMAKYLDALLLKDGDVIIDESVIEKLK